jgi:hypothetical protein
VVDAAVWQPLRLVPFDALVHHRERSVEVVPRERLVRAADGVDVDAFGVTTSLHTKADSFAVVIP